MPFLDCKAKALQDVVHLAPRQCAPEVSQFPTVPSDQLRSFIYSFCPTVRNRWTDCRALTISQHICHPKPWFVSYNCIGYMYIAHHCASNLIETRRLDYSAPKEGMISAKIRFALEKVS